MKITVATLIYKSPAYLDFVMESLLEHHSENHDVQYLIVCNDATKEVLIAASRWSSYLSHNYDPKIKIVVHKNANPDDWWIQNVYNAWNRCLLECETEAICFVNSDMAFTDGWLDALAKYDLLTYIPTSRLVESGRMPSLPGLISKDFGQTLVTFKKKEFEEFARVQITPHAWGNKGAYMPSLFNTQRLRDAGGWQKNKGNWPGDKITYAILAKKFGMQHLMVGDSIAYHFQRGESAEAGDL